MTTEPGVLPKEYDELDFKSLAPQMQHAIQLIKLEVLNEEKNPQKIDEDTVRAAPVDFSKSIEEVNAAVAASKY